MQAKTLLGNGVAVSAVLLSSNVCAAALSQAQAQQLDTGAAHPYIVIMKRNSLTGDDALTDQTNVMSELNQVHAQRIKQFHALNSLAATVTDQEATHLRAHPDVALIVPDVVIAYPRKLAGGAPGSGSSTVTAHVIPGACGANGKVLLDPEALQTTSTDSDAANAKTARSLGFTGAGVKVAFIADGIDTNNANFIRKNGQSAFIDYQDFSGDGPEAPTSGDEAFLDANSIAGQGLVTYNVSGFSAQPDPGACNIRIEGVAPGASLVGLKAFGAVAATTQSDFLEAIDYAVTVAHVDVLNESFGGNPFPDSAAVDVTKLFNEAAVKAGVTVTVSSGDAGPTNTIGSPAGDPSVISTGASTTYRFYAQTNYAVARYFSTSGWLDDNISPLSSGGYTQTGATLDLVAPGDSGFASCDANPVFSGCTNFLNASATLERAGGTSESAPLTAGAAALVIEAYRKSHHGASPTPALVKQILTSSATDLGTPAVEQGAGILNTYKAVLLAQSVGNGAGSAVGQSLLLSRTQLNGSGAPGTAQGWPVTVTNTGTLPQTVAIRGRTFGADANVQTGAIGLTDGTSPQFVDFAGVPNNYGTFEFQVPAGQDRLFGQIAYPAPAGAPLNARVRLILIDPAGRFAAHSVPQGVGNSGSVDVREPLAGTWTGVIFCDMASAGGTNGIVPWQVSTEKFAPFASVSPSTLALAPGQSQTMNVSARTPSTPGDTSGSIVLTSTSGGTDPFVGAESNSIPVTLRSLVDVAHGGTFSGALTGGNGRANGEGQTNSFEFQVPAGQASIMANVTLANDPQDPVGAYLIGPDGTALGFGQNSLGTQDTRSLTAYTLNPAVGTWTLIVDFAEPVVGNEVSQPFSGNIKLNNVSVRAPGLPNSPTTVLRAGVPVTVPVTITNNGAAPEAFFIDARLNSTASLTLTSLDPPATSAGYSLPLAATATPPLWLVPTESSRVNVNMTANVPIMFDYGPNQGDPDLVGLAGANNTASGSFAPSGGVLQAGIWAAVPTEIGPFAGAAIPGLAVASMTVTSKAFDPAVTTAGGDLWEAGLNPASFSTFAPVVINPGQSATINVTITPSGASGTVVSGNLYVDDSVNAVPPYGETTGDELAALSYTYTIL